MRKSPEFENARDYCINRLENELSSKLTYHNLEHTVKEVVPAADRLATLEKVSDDNRVLLLTAAYYHDLGFVRQREDHESASIALAEQILPDYGFSGSQIALIRDIIQATCIPQRPTNLLGRIMADADLDYLGQENFWKRSNDLRLELDNNGVKFTDEDWYLYQLRFIQAHQYFTSSERLLREALKQQHLLEIKKRLDQVIKVKQIN